MIKPILTEKSLKNAKEGKYTFWVDAGSTKPEIKSEIAKIFGVNVVSVKTLTLRQELKKNFKGFRSGGKMAKKAIVELKSDQKIDLFEEKK